MEVPEHIARSLTLEELAHRLQDHDQPAVRMFAERVIDAMVRCELDENDDN